MTKHKKNKQHPSFQDWAVQDRFKELLKEHPPVASPAYPPAISSPCPSCGRCPACGRTDRFRPLPGPWDAGNDLTYCYHSSKDSF